jgi:hypothetical protein
MNPDPAPLRCGSGTRRRQRLDRGPPVPSVRRSRPGPGPESHRHPEDAVAGTGARKVDLISANTPSRGWKRVFGRSFRRVLNRCRPYGLPKRKAGEFSAGAPRTFRPVPSPRPRAALASGPGGGQSPRPAPDPAGASRPPGRALACVVPGSAGLQGTVPRGRGNAVRFLFPPGEGAEQGSCT